MHMFWPISSEYRGAMSRCLSVDTSAVTNTLPAPRSRSPGTLSDFLRYALQTGRVIPSTNKTHSRPRDGHQSTSIRVTCNGRSRNLDNVYNRRGPSCPLVYSTLSCSCKRTVFWLQMPLSSSNKWCKMILPRNNRAFLSRNRTDVIIQNV